MAEATWRLMAVHAHPDDEAVATGGTLARYAAAGAYTVLVTCTGGEEGEIVDDELKAAIADSAPSPAVAQERLRAQREIELRAAVAALHISQHYQLGYRDSGMAGTESTQHPDAFTNVDVGAAVARLVEIVRRERPQVMITYDTFGGYGHPDHIMAHRIAVLAFDGAANSTVFPPQSAATPPWQPLKLYYIAQSRERMARFDAQAATLGIDPPFGNVVARQAEAVLRGQPVDPEHPERPPRGVPDDAITTVIDISDYLAAKTESLRVHRTQAVSKFPLIQSKLPEEFVREIYGVESFTLVRSRVPACRPEVDLFAGIAP